MICLRGGTRAILPANQIGDDTKSRPRGMKPTPHLTITSTKNWDDEIAPLKKALGGLKLGEHHLNRTGKIGRALRKALETTDCTIISLAIANALFDAFEQGKAQGAPHETKMPT